MAKVPGTKANKRSGTTTPRLTATSNIAQYPMSEPSLTASAPITNEHPTEKEASSTVGRSAPLDASVIAGNKPKTTKPEPSKPKPTKPEPTKPTGSDFDSPAHASNADVLRHQTDTFVMRLPTTDLSFKCADCEWSSAYNPTLFKKHCLEVHSKTVEIKYRCSGCNRDLTTKWTCNRHISTCPLQNPPPEQPTTEEQPAQEDAAQSETVPKRSHKKKSWALSAPGDTPLLPLPAKRARRPPSNFLMEIEAPRPRHALRKRHSLEQIRPTVVVAPQPVAPNDQPTAAQRMITPPDVQPNTPAAQSQPEASPAPMWETRFYAGLGRKIVRDKDGIEGLANMVQTPGGVEVLTKCAPMFHKITGDIVNALGKKSANEE